MNSRVNHRDIFRHKIMLFDLVTQELVMMARDIGAVSVIFLGFA
jgi:hypothetical protein